MVYPGSYATTRPDHPAVVLADGQTLTYAELERRSIRLAAHLRAAGLRRGDGVALLAENHLRFFEVYWAAMRSGLYFTAANWHLAPAEAAYLIADSGARALVTTAQQAQTAAEAVATVPGCTVRLMIDGTAPGFANYDDALAASDATPPHDQPLGQVMLYSSGTTGRPKGIRRALRDVQVSDPEAAGVSRLGGFLLGMGPDTVYLCPAPLYHAAGLQWSAGVHELGGTLVQLPRFDAEELLRVIERYRVTHVQVVPTMLVRLLKLPEEVRRSYDLSSLRYVIHAAAPCPPDVKRQTLDWLGPIVHEYYAATEGAGLTYIGPEDWLAHPGSVGKALLGEPHICDEQGRELPPGEPGLIYFGQDGPPFEYHRAAEKTAESRHPAYPNWTTTGDVGYLDEDGYLYLTDRKNFTIISGGVNIYPAEIESCLALHPKISDVAVIGLPDPEMGEFVHAVVEPAPGVDGTAELAEELRAYVRQHLAGFKVPRSVDFRATLPRLPTGKLQKSALRAEYLESAHS
ncbi:acyl-CoA synthetase [Cryptosporangium aurantiacum]|uniref:Acyl-CoA synthetase (AMP-forming)/AMP-acid ligase II n=1 Tax=Cryptosporangium aurantiacum TaxID=134849 RepID=A0A1M7RKC9_9ACTN|nr:acyl-CoA synthetase [Cryptosporangium aurantiacum]SHN46606.1 Acyl-CoA synthetase (AMP-forming)/AMP-acid ligase II [Cryptosporangium aurantiacum]